MTGLAVTLVENGRQYTVTTNEIGQTVLAPTGNLVTPSQPLCSHPCQQVTCQKLPCQPQPAQPQYQPHCQMTNDVTEIRTDNGSQSVRVRNASPARPVPSVDTDAAFSHRVMYPRCSPDPQQITSRDTYSVMDGVNQPRIISQCCSGVQAVDGRYASTYQANYCNVKPTSPEVMISEFPPQRTGPTHSGKGQCNFVVGGQGSMIMEDYKECSPRPGSPVRNQGWSDSKDVSPARTISPSPTRNTSFRSGTIGESAVHHAFAHSLRKYPDQRATNGDHSSEVLEKLVTYSQLRSLNKSPTPDRRRTVRAGIPHSRSPEPGQCRSASHETELDFCRYGGSGKKNTAAALSSLDQYTIGRRLAFNKAIVDGDRVPCQDKDALCTICRRLAFNKAVDGDRVPCQTKPTQMPYYTSPYVSYKEKYKRAEQEFKERMKQAEIVQAPLKDIDMTPGQDIARKLLAVPLSTVVSNAVSTDATGVLPKYARPPSPFHPCQLFAAPQFYPKLNVLPKLSSPRRATKAVVNMVPLYFQEAVSQNLRKRSSQGGPGDRRISQKRLGRKKSVTHPRKTWGCLSKIHMMPKNLLQNKNSRLHSPGQHSILPLQSIIMIKPYESSSATQISCRSSVTVLIKSDTGLCQTKVDAKHPHNLIAADLVSHKEKHSRNSPNIEAVVRKTNPIDVDGSQSRRSNSPYRERNENGTDLHSMAAGETRCYETNHNKSIPNSPRTPAEFLKAQIMGNNGMEMYEDLSHIAGEIIRKNAAAEDRAKLMNVKRNASATCIKTSEEIFSLDDRKLYIKNSKSQQIVKPKTVKLHEEILYLLQDVPLQPSKDPKERMIRREVLKKLFRKLRHLTHKMEMTESDEDLLRNIRNCLKSVLDCERCNRNKHWDSRKCDKYHITQFHVPTKKLPTQDDVILKTLITHWFNSIELKVITSQHKEKFLKSIIEQQLAQFANRPSSNAEYKDIIEANIIDFLRKLPLITDSECRRTVVIHQLTTKLVEEIMALAKNNQETNVPVVPRENYTHLKVFRDNTPARYCMCHHKSMEDAIPPHEKELRNVITTEISSFVFEKKLISDVIHNVEQDVTGILIESLDCIKQGEDNNVKTQLMQFLKETKCFSQSYAAQLTENLMDSLKQTFIIADAHVKKDTSNSGQSTTTVVLHSKSVHNLSVRKRDKTRFASPKQQPGNDTENTSTCANKPGTSNNQNNNAVDGILDVTDEDISNNFSNYTTKLIQQTEQWLMVLQAQVPLAGDEGFRAVVVYDLAHDIADRQKYLQMNPSKRAKSADESEYLKFQIFKWISKLVAGKNKAILSHAPQLMEKIQNIPVPLLTKSSQFKLHQSINTKERNIMPGQALSITEECVKSEDHFEEYKKRLGMEIKTWLRELPRKVTETSVHKVDSQIVSMLVRDISKGIQEETETCNECQVNGVIDKEVPPWVKNVTQCTENKQFSLNDCIESLKARIQSINVPIFREKVRGETEEPRKELCCEDLYDYPRSYFTVRRVLDEWIKRETFLPSCNKELLSEQLDSFAQNLHEIILTQDLTTCEITRRIKDEISNTLYILPLPPKSKYLHASNPAVIIEDLWSMIKQDKDAQQGKKQSKQKDKHKEKQKNDNSKAVYLKTETCYLLSSASSNGSQPTSSQTKNLRFSEPHLNQTPEAARCQYCSSSVAADRSLNQKMSTINEKSSYCTKAQDESKKDTQCSYKNQISEQRRRNTIDGSLLSDRSLGQNSSTTKEKVTCCGKAFEKNKKDSHSLNKTIEERRRNSIGDYSTNKTAAKDNGCSSPVNRLTPDKIHENLTKFLTEWCEKVPMEEVGQEHVSVVRQGLLNGIGKQIIKIRSDPLAIQDRFLTEDMLDGELDSLLDCLPQTPALENKKLRLKYELMEYVADTNQQLYDVYMSQSYRQELKEALEKSLPKPKHTSAELEILQEILKENLIDEFIQANYAGIDPNRRVLFHKKIQQELSKLARELVQKGQSEPMDVELLRSEVYNALHKVPVPTEETLLEQVKECLVRQEITAWYKDLPISHAHGEEELHNHTNKNLLAKKIIEIEKQAEPNDLSVELNIKHEISKFINKFRLHPGEDLNINFMVDELTNRMRNNAALNDPNLRLPIPSKSHKADETLFPDLRQYHQFSDYIPLSSTLDTKRHPETKILSSSLDSMRQAQGATSPYDISAIEHETLFDKSVNMKAPRGRTLSLTPQTEYQRGISLREKSPRQHWRNAFSAFKKQLTTTPTVTTDNSKQQVSLQELNESEKEQGQQSCGQQSCGKQSHDQQSEVSRTDDTLSRVQERDRERKVSSTRRILGTSQVAGPSCCDRSMKASDVMFKSVMEWCHQIPFMTDYPENEKQFVRAEIATKLISKVGELNLDPNVLQDDFIYEGMLCSIVDHILDTVPQSTELEYVRAVLKDEIIQRLQQARMLAIVELRVHSYRKEINETISKVTQPSNTKVREQHIVDSAVKEKIADALIEIKFEEKDKKQCKKKLIDAIHKYNNESTTGKITSKVQEKLAEALVELPAPAKEALAEEVEEVKLKNEISEWYKKIPLIEAPYSPEDTQKTNKLISLLAKELHELEKESTLANYVELIRIEIQHWTKRLPVNPNQTCKLNQLVDEFANQLKTTEPSRRLLPQRHDETSSSSSFRTSQSMPLVGGPDTSIVNLVNSQSVTKQPCNQTSNQSYPLQSACVSGQHNPPQYQSLPYNQSQNRSITSRLTPYNQQQNLSVRYPSQNASITGHSCCQSQTASISQPAHNFHAQNVPRRSHQNPSPKYCYVPQNAKMPDYCKLIGGQYNQPQYPYPKAPQIPQVCYRPSPHNQKMMHESETPTDEENLKLYCQCSPTPPLCQQKRTQFYFSPPCHLYEEFKKSKTCKKCSKNQCSNCIRES